MQEGSFVKASGRVEVDETFIGGKKRPLQKHVKEHVHPGAEVLTHALKSYEGLEAEYVHQIIDHAVEYVKGHVHTNGLENFWSLLKRTPKGTYTFVDRKYLWTAAHVQGMSWQSRNVPFPAK